jgi:hypothetical protein
VSILFTMIWHVLISLVFHIMEYFHLNIFRFIILLFLISSKLCTVFTSSSQLQFNLYKNLLKFFYSVILLQLFVFLCAISSSMNRHLSFKNYYLQFRVSWHFSNTSYPLIRHTGDIFLFLHLSLCPLVSKFPIETTLTTSLIPTAMIYIHFSPLLLFQIPFWD